MLLKYLLILLTLSLENLQALASPSLIKKDVMRPLSKNLDSPDLANHLVMTMKEILKINNCKQFYKRKPISIFFSPTLNPEFNLSSNLKVLDRIIFTLEKKKNISTSIFQDMQEIFEGFFQRTYQHRVKQQANIEHIVQLIESLDIKIGTKDWRVYQYYESTFQKNVEEIKKYIDATSLFLSNLLKKLTTIENAMKDIRTTMLRTILLNHYIKRSQENLLSLQESVNMVQKKLSYIPSSLKIFIEKFDFAKNTFTFLEMINNDICNVKQFIEMILPNNTGKKFTFLDNGIEHLAIIDQFLSQKIKILTEQRKKLQDIQKWNHQENPYPDLKINVEEKILLTTKHLCMVEDKFKENILAIRRVFTIRHKLDDPTKTFPQLISA